MDTVEENPHTPLKQNNSPFSLGSFPFLVAKIIFLCFREKTRKRLWFERTFDLIKETNEYKVIVDSNVFEEENLESGILLTIEKILESGEEKVKKLIDSLEERNKVLQKKMPVWYGSYVRNLGFGTSIRNYYKCDEIFLNDTEVNIGGNDNNNEMTELPLLEPLSPDAYQQSPPSIDFTENEENVGELPSPSGLPSPSLAMSSEQPIHEENSRERLFDELEERIILGQLIEVECRILKRTIETVKEEHEREMEKIREFCSSLRENREEFLRNLETRYECALSKKSKLESDN